MHTASGKGTLKNSDVLVRDGVIVAIGGDAGGSNATVIDAKGRALTPGLFGGLNALWASKRSVGNRRPSIQR